MPAKRSTRLPFQHPPAACLFPPNDLCPLSGSFVTGFPIYAASLWLPPGPQTAKIAPHGLGNGGRARHEMSFLLLPAYRLPLAVPFCSCSPGDHLVLFSIPLSPNAGRQVPLQQACATHSPLLQDVDHNAWTAWQAPRLSPSSPVRFPSSSRQILTSGNRVCTLSRRGTGPTRRTTYRCHMEAQSLSRTDHSPGLERRRQRTSA